MSCIPHSIDFQVDVVVLGFLFALGFRLFDYVVWLCKDLFNIVEEILSERKSRNSPKN